MQNIKDTVLLVEDDPCIREIAKHDLQNDGYHVLEASNACKVFEVLKSTHQIDSILLDIGLPDGNGLDLISKIREHTDAPIIIVSGRDGTTDRVIGLEMGADDYISKPVEIREFLARVKAHVRRYKESYKEFYKESLNLLPATLQKKPLRIKFGRWVLDRSKYQIFDEDGSDGTLTTKEFILLDALITATGRTLSREHLFTLVRGENSDSYDRAVDVQITRIRHKICEDARHPQMIKTVRGIGYMFEGKIEIIN